MATLNFNPNININVGGGSSGGGGSAPPPGGSGPQQPSSGGQVTGDFTDADVDALLEGFDSSLKVHMNPITKEFHTFTNLVVPIFRMFPLMGGTMANIMVTLGRVAYGVKAAEKDTSTMTKAEKLAFREKQKAKAVTLAKWTAGLAIGSGILAAVLAILSISKIFRQMMGITFQILGMFMDIFVLPLIPIFLSMYRIMIKHLPDAVKFSQTMAKLMEALNPAIDVIVEALLRSVLPGISGIIADIPAFVNLLVLITSSITNDLIPKITQWFADNKDGIANLIEGAKQLYQFIITGFPIQAMLDFIKGIFDALFGNKDALASLKNVITSIFGAFQTISSWVKDNIGSLVKDIPTHLTNFLNLFKLLPTISSMVSVVGAWISNSGKDILDTITSIFSWINSNIDMTGVLNWLKDIATVKLPELYNTIKNSLAGGLMGLWGKPDMTGLPQKALGGFIPQNTLAMLHAGEFVVPKMGVQHMVNMTQNFNVGGSSFSDNINTSKLLSQLMKDSLSGSILRVI